MSGDASLQTSTCYWNRKHLNTLRNSAKSPNTALQQEPLLSAWNRYPKTRPQLVALPKKRETLRIYTYLTLPGANSSSFFPRTLRISPVAVMKVPLTLILNSPLVVLKSKCPGVSRPGFFISIPETCSLETSNSFFLSSSPAIL